MPTTPPPSPSTPRWFGIDLVRNRWLFPLAGLLGTAIGGSTYAISVFVNPWEDEFGWERAETLSALAVAILATGAAMFLGGIAVDRMGPRPVLAAGGVLAAFGMFNASRIDTLTEFSLGFGACFGIGVGLIYSASTIALVARWYPDPDKRGAAIGWSVVGFGMSAVIVAPLWTWGLDAVGWRDTFVISSVVVAVIAVVLVSLVRFPPSDWTWTAERGWHPDPDAAPDAGIQHYAWDLTLGEAIRSRYLWALGLLFLFSTSGGLLAIGQAAAWAEEDAPSGLGVSAGLAAIVVMALSLANGSGRPTFGWVSARIGLRRSMVLAYTLLAVGLVALAVSTSVWMAIPAALVTGLAFGGALSLNPVMTAFLFGVTSLGRIYGFLFLVGFGLGGVVGPLLGGALYDRLDDYAPVFLVAAGASVLAALSARLLLPAPGKERQHTARSQAAFDEMVAALSAAARRDPAPLAGGLPPDARSVDDGAEGAAAAHPADVRIQRPAADR